MRVEYMTGGPCAKASLDEEPGAGKLHAGICAGGARQRASLPRYSPELGRWINRDPIEGLGFLRLSTTEAVLERYRRQGVRDMVGLYVFAGNDSVVTSDLLGLGKIIEISVDFPNPCAAPGLNTHELRGALVCYRGKQIGCVWPKNWKGGKLSEEVLKCALDHESLHTTQDIDSQCNACEKLPYVYEMLPEPDPKKHDTRELAVECPAYKAMQECFDKIGDSTLDGYEEMKKLLEEWREKCKGTPSEW